MVFAVPLLTSRVAPRCTAADGLLLVTVDRNRVISRRTYPFGAQATVELVDLLKRHSVATLVCGGISTEMREAMQAHGIAVMENVACSGDEIVTALEAGVLRPGLGFGATQPLGKYARPQRTGSTTGDSAVDWPRSQHLDCLRCADRRCLRGEDCRDLTTAPVASPAAETCRMLEAASDVALESERQLCRLAELVYFCLEMEYEKIGIAFCIELHEPAGILAGVLGRFFEVFPVCCKIGGRSLNQLMDPSVESGAGTADFIIGCNPLAQAEVLNQACTDLNVIVGLCIGADSVFSRASMAPVSTLFVKDKSLANNPIGALYSEYYLRESVAPDRPTLRLDPAGRRGSSRKHEEAS